jgi:hypothetical protein
MLPSVSPALTVYVSKVADAAAAGGALAAGAGPPVTWMSATTSFCQVGIVLIAFQISFFSASVATVPLKYSLPSRSSALPWNFPFDV